MFEELRYLTLGRSMVVVQESIRRLCLCRYIYENYYEEVVDKKRALELIDAIIKYSTDNNLMFSEVLADILQGNCNIEGIDEVLYGGLDKLALYLVNGNPVEENKLSEEVKKKAEVKAHKLMIRMVERHYEYEIKDGQII